MKEDHNDAISNSIDVSMTKVIRPGISLFEVIRPGLKYLIPLVVGLIITWVVFVNLDISLLYLLIFPFILLMIVILNFKEVLVGGVIIYQRYAPSFVRQACRFEPSCSNYMLMSVEKYGAGKGFAKGIRRICRCHYPNGGVDYP